MMAMNILLLSLSFAGVLGDDYSMPDLGGLGGLGGKGKSCPAYKCSKGYEPAPARPLKLSASGCSGMGGGMVMSMAQESDGPVEHCCSRRTACFQTCGASKAACEKEFEKCTKTACAGIADDEEKKSCDSTANLQVMMAGFGDCREFDAAQSKGCKCLAPEKALTQREKTLQDFYKKHAPSDVGKVKGLIEKSGQDPKKFAALLNKLVAKYPEAIKIKKSEQQEMMDRIMREAREKKSTDDDEGGGEGGQGAGWDEGEDKGPATNGEGVEDLDALLKEEL